MRTNALALALVISFGLASCASAPRATAPTHLDVRADWTLTDYDGVAHEVGSFLARGEPVVLVFWETWCGSCIAEAPEVERAHRKYPRVHFIGVVAGGSNDVDESEVRATALRLGLTYPQVMDRDLALTKGLDVRGTPTIVVLGRGGEVLNSGHELPQDWSRFGG